MSGGVTGTHVINEGGRVADDNARDNAILALQSGKLDASTAAGLYRLQDRYGVILVGDSRVAREVVTVAGTSIGTSEQGAFTWGNANAGNRLNVVKYAGVAGNTTAQILARWATDVTPFTAGWVFIQAGVNDCNGSVSTATLKANLQTMFANAKAENRRVLLCTIAPDNSFTSAARLVCNQVNRWMKTQLTDPDIVVVDVAAMVTDAAGGGWLSSCSADGLHANRNGAARQGIAITKVLKSVIPERDWLASSPNDTENWVPFAWMLGTVGATAPTGWSTSGTATYSTVARTDFGRGQWGQIDTSAAAANTYLYQNATSPSIPAGIVAGTDSAYGVAEVQFDATTSFDHVTFDVQFRSSADAILYTTSAFVHDDTATALTAGLEPGLTPGTAVLVTPPGLVPATATKFWWRLNWQGQGKIRAGAAAIYKA